MVLLCMGKSKHDFHTAMTYLHESFSWSEKQRSLKLVLEAFPHPSVACILHLGCSFRSLSSIFLWASHQLPNWASHALMTLMRLPRNVAWTRRAFDILLSPVHQICCPLLKQFFAPCSTNRIWQVELESPAAFPLQPHHSSKSCLENCCDHTACRSDSSKEVQKISKAHAAWVIIYASERFAAKTLELSPKIFQADRSGHLRWHLFWFCKLLFDWSLLTATPRSCRSMGTKMICKLRDVPGVEIIGQGTTLTSSKPHHQWPWAARHCDQSYVTNVVQSDIAEITFCKQAAHACRARASVLPSPRGYSMIWLEADQWR